MKGLLFSVMDVERALLARRVTDTICLVSHVLRPYQSGKKMAFKELNIEVDIDNV